MKTTHNEVSAIAGSWVLAACCLSPVIFVFQYMLDV
jgi:hypothetical protein